ncbi:hypothetical protein N6H14_14745 [Paenibacillus sp. CC-CFT747]|nr:hypothetical protein N6H14_14745 [Paenibacillus sp. CC-CFT747]
MSIKTPEALMNRALTELIAEQAKAGSFGLVILGIEDIPVKELVVSVGGPERVYVSLVGLEQQLAREITNWAHSNGWSELGFGIGATHAVDVRNQAPPSAIKLVLAWREEERLPSVTARGYQYIGASEVIKQICAIGAASAGNIPEASLWRAFTSEKLAGKLSSLKELSNTT